MLGCAVVSWTRARLRPACLAGDCEGGCLAAGLLLSSLWLFVVSLFNISVVELLMAPYMLYTGKPTMDVSVLVEADSILGGWWRLTILITL